MTGARVSWATSSFYDSLTLFYNGPGLPMPGLAGYRRTSACPPGVIPVCASALSLWHHRDTGP